MSFPDITELSNAYALCICGTACTRACTVCASVTWCSGPCVRQLWDEHAASDEGKAAAKRFDDMISLDDKLIATTAPPPIPMYDEFPYSQRTDAIEKWIDYMDAEVGLEPWQANLIRWMLDGSPTRHR